MVAAATAAFARSIWYDSPLLMSFAPAAALAIATTFAVCSPAAQSALPASWLDRPLANWNQPSVGVPPPPAAEEPAAEVLERCRLTPPAGTPGEQALAAAGWIPFWIVDRQLLRDDVEIVGGMRTADGMCRPDGYNAFVFVGGRIAGVLSPTPMSSRSDSAAGVVRMAPPVISAEFARYAPSDPLCCPSSRQTVRYRIDRSAAGPLVVPSDVRTTRP